MRRWTDGKSWSASRVSGSFLTYREMEGKRGGNNYAPPISRAGKTPDSTRGSDSDMDMAGDEGPDGYRYKPDGLMKQSFSITTSIGNHLHLISYYSRQHAGPALVQPSNDPALRHIRPQKGMYPESTVHEQQNIPAVTRTPMNHTQAPHMAPMVGYPPRPGHTHPLAYPQQPHFHQWSSPPPGPTTNGYASHYNPPSTLPPPPPPSYTLQPTMGYNQSMPPISQPLYNGTSTPPTDGGLPRPHVSSHHRNTSSGSYHQLLPNPSPRASHASLAPPPAQASQNNSPSSTPPMSKIDPRLMNPSPLSQHTSLPGLSGGSSTRTPSPAPSKREVSITPTSKDTMTSSASTIPSIGAIMNSTTADNYDIRSRSASRSPGGTRKDGPQDIPHEKLGFGEDIRALRVLDRAFKT